MRAVATLFLLLSTTAVWGDVVCRNGSVVPAVLRKAAAGVPLTAAIPMNVGTRLPSRVPTAPLPKVLGQILPQYPGYRAVRTRRVVAIVDPRSRRIAYLLPLDLAQPLDCPDS